MLSVDIPELLRGVVPVVGSTWVWEPLKSYARQRVRVTAVTWNGEEVWVECQTLPDGGLAWNELSRWVEATVLEDPGEL